MTIAISIGTHNVSVLPIILAVIVIGVAIYVIRRRRRNPRSGQDR